MTPPRVFAYICDDPDCPEQFRAVAHSFERRGQNGSKAALDLSVPTGTGRTVGEAVGKLSAFWDNEAQKEEARQRKAKATGERIRAMHAAKREAKS